MQNRLLWEGPCTGAGEEHEEKKCYELTTTPIPRPPAPLSGEEVEKLRLKLSQGRRGRGKVCFVLFFSPLFLTISVFNCQ